MEFGKAIQSEILNYSKQSEDHYMQNSRNINSLPNYNKYC